jgi:hypothetical protein
MALFVAVFDGGIPSDTSDPSFGTETPNGVPLIAEERHHEMSW